MNTIKILPSYFLWHYSISLVEFLGVFRNILWAQYRLFSIPTLLKDLFYPWHRLDEQYKSGFNIESFVETFILNSLMRIIGAIMRSLVILSGILTMFLTIVLGFIILGIWIFMPIIILASFIHSLSILIE